MSRAIDFTIGKELFGYTFHHDDSEFLPASLSEMRFCDCPHFTASIAAAWLVVERLKEFDPSVEYSTEHKFWTACFEPLGHSIPADTAPMAICKAALKALGIEVPDE